MSVVVLAGLPGTVHTPPSVMADDRPIYLDHQATTPCDARVVDAMLPFLSGEFGNAASRTHAYGWEAARAVDVAREQVARAIGGRARDVVFTSGATEANNLAILGVVRAAMRAGAKRPHVVTARTEHRAVLDPCRALEAEGVRVTVLDVDAAGRLAPEVLAAALTRDTLLVSLMHANNEIGVVHDLSAYAAVTRAAGTLLHSDAAQSVGKIAVDVEALGVDLLSFTGHKVYGPKGIGVLWRRPSVLIAPLVHGGGHEHGLRSGTVPVPLAVGLGVACDLAREGFVAESRRVRALRERLWAGLDSGLAGVRINGHPTERLPGNLNVSFDGIESEALLMALPELALSSGSACTSAKPEASHVLTALGLSPASVHASLRFGIGRHTTGAEIDRTVAALVREVTRLRALAPA